MTNLINLLAYEEILFNHKDFGNLLPFGGISINGPPRISPTKRGSMG